MLFPKGRITHPFPEAACAVSVCPLRPAMVNAVTANNVSFFMKTSFVVDSESFAVSEMLQNCYKTIIIYFHGL